MRLNILKKNLREREIEREREDAKDIYDIEGVRYGESPFVSESSSLHSVWSKREAAL